MEQVKRYEFEDEVIEVPLRWDGHLKRYVGDYEDCCKRPGHTPAGRPILLTIEDACPMLKWWTTTRPALTAAPAATITNFPAPCLGYAGMNKDTPA